MAWTSITLFLHGYFFYLIAFNFKTLAMHKRNIEISYPIKLTTEEAANPYQVIADFCNYDHLHGIQDKQWRLLYATVTGSFHKMHQAEKEGLLRFLQYMEKTLEAVHAIHARKVKDHGELALYNSLRESIIQSGKHIPGIDKIFLANTHLQNDHKVSVLYIIANNAHKSFDHYHMQIDKYFPEPALLNVMFLKAADVHHYLKAGRLFYANICKPEKLLFSSMDSFIPAPGKIPKENIKSTFIEHIAQVQAYFEQAAIFMQKQDHKSALLLLHQTTEHLLRAFLTALTGHPIPRQSIYSLLKQTLFITDEIAAVFTPRQLCLLNSACLNNNGAINRGQLEGVFESVGRVQEVVRRVFEGE